MVNGELHRPSLQQESTSARVVIQHVSDFSRQSDPRKRLYPADLRHHYIREQQINWTSMRTTQTNRFRATLRIQYAVTSLHQDLSRQAAHDVFVFDEENSL
jgi:hypothetical protein